GHSGPRPAALTTFVQRSVSFLTCATNTSGVPGVTSIPCSSSFVLRAGFSSSCSRSAVNFACTAGGNGPGVQMPYQDDTSKPGTPPSANVGTSGTCLLRAAEGTPSTLTRLDLIAASAPPTRLPVYASISPPMTAGRACAAPLNGTWTILMPASSLKSSTERCGEAPTPEDP